MDFFLENAVILSSVSIFSEGLSTELRCDALSVGCSFFFFLSGNGTLKKKGHPVGCFMLSFFLEMFYCTDGTDGTDGWDGDQKCP